MAYSCELIHKDPSGARAGRLTTPHGRADTPLFMPVGTKASVKAMTPEELAGMGVEMILANTYHLWLRPGHEVIRVLGGLHAFMNWKGPVLTDSGGFQVFSLAPLRRITEEGVSFRSHLDGSECFLSPETAIEAQEAIGADVIMPLDDCTPYPADRLYVKDSMELTLRWAQRSRRAHGISKANQTTSTVRPGQALFGIVQGGMHADLRQESAKRTVETGFDGYAIGGLSVGEEKGLMYGMIDAAMPHLPASSVRYLMGVGMPEDIVEAVERGVDMFDCVLPTRCARNGTLFTSKGKLVIKNSLYAKDPRPVDEECPCYACRNYSRAYLRHLYMAGELLSSRLNTTHNLCYYMRLMKGIGEAVKAGRFAEFKRRFYEVRNPGAA
ncbi:MAG: tRNA guanosine(34) transglycosylase Tgt [Deltaproteobacteria bacterium]|nr:tRNA guanosine(34) transglycosylase Tgt [Deltaproteobacteria bacterium]